MDEPRTPTPDKPLSEAERLASILRDARRQALREARTRLGPQQPDGATPSDIAQSAVREILQGAEDLEYHNEPAFRGLVSQVLLRKISAKLRHAQAGKRDARMARPLEAEPADDGPGPVTQAEVREYQSQIQSQLTNLSDQQRAALQLRLEGHSHEEIANQLGITLANAFKTVSRARDKLRDHFG